MTAPARISLPHWPRLMSEELACAYIGLGKTILREQGPKPKRMGRRVLYDIRDLDRWADSLDGQPLEAEEREQEGDGMAERIRRRLANGSH